MFETFADAIQAIIDDLTAFFQTIVTFFEGLIPEETPDENEGE